MQLTRAWLLVVMLSTWACGQGPQHAASVAIITEELPLTDEGPQVEALHLAEVTPGFPIVLLHGMAGFRPVLGRFDYFYKVRRLLLDAGHPVFTTHVDPFQTVEYRAAQLGGQIEAILTATGAAKVHLVAHSQGGLDARYLISKHNFGDRIATLVTIGTPHHGVRLVDAAFQRVPGIAAKVVARITNAFANMFFGGKSDVLAQLRDVSASFVEYTFNPQVLDDPRVAYFSYAGHTQGSLFVDLRQIDLVNPLLHTTHHLLRRTDGDNDGIVGTDAARWGTYLGALPADHWDEIGQLPGTPHLSFRHLDFYRGIADFLRNNAQPPIF